MEGAGLAPRTCAKRPPKAWNWVAPADDGSVALANAGGRVG